MIWRKLPPGSSRLRPRTALAASGSRAGIPARKRVLHGHRALRSDAGRGAGREGGAVDGASAARDVIAASTASARLCDPAPASTTPSATRTVSETLTTSMTTSRSSRSGLGQCRATAAPGQNSMNTNAPATRKRRPGRKDHTRQEQQPPGCSERRATPPDHRVPAGSASVRIVASGSWNTTRNRPDSSTASSILRIEPAGMRPVVSTSAC